MDNTTILAEISRLERQLKRAQENVDKTKKLLAHYNDQLNQDKAPKK